MANLYITTNNFDICFSEKSVNLQESTVIYMNEIQLNSCQFNLSLCSFT